jgi:hypothetical protein
VDVAQIVRRDPANPTRLVDRQGEVHSV